MKSDKETNYYKLSVDDTLKSLGTAANGLSPNEVTIRHQKYGESTIQEKRLLLSKY